MNEYEPVVITEVPECRSEARLGDMYDRLIARDIPGFVIRYAMNDPVSVTELLKDRIQKMRVASKNTIVPISAIRHIGYGAASGFMHTDGSKGLGYSDLPSARLNVHTTYKGEMRVCLATLLRGAYNDCSESSSKSDITIAKNREIISDLQHGYVKAHDLVPIMAQTRVSAGDSVVFIEKKFDPMVLYQDTLHSFSSIESTRQSASVFLVQPPVNNDWSYDLDADINNIFGGKKVERAELK